MGRAFPAGSGTGSSPLRERRSRLSPHPRSPAGPASAFRSRLPTARLAPAWRAAAVCAALLGSFAAAGAARAESPRLLTGLTAEAGPDGVVLSWTVDESRADRIAGLPEYGEYLFEVVARTNAGAGIPWPERALHVRVTVTEALAGPPGRAVTGAGPLVEGCGPDGDDRPWRLDQVVSAAHLTHYPGRGWSPAGDPGAAPDWPEPTPIAALIRDAGLDPEPLREALSGTGADAAALARTLGDARFDAALARAGAGTKALLRLRADGARELKLHSSYPFGAPYLFEARHAVPGWGDAGHPAAWPALWNRVDCPPPGSPGATHDVALALSDAAGDGRRLAHSVYGWWAVSPVGLGPERIVAAKAGLSGGDPAAAPPEAPALWRGRLSGHLFFDRHRWAVAADVTLTLEAGTPPRLTGRIGNIALARLDAKSLRPAAGAPGSLPPLLLETAADGAAAPAGGWSGPVRVAAESVAGAPAGLPSADAFRGDWLAASHGPGAAEVAGRLRLWTPLPAGADPANDWPAQAVLAAGFGALREDR